MRVNEQRFREASGYLKELLPKVMEAESLENLRGLEGSGASIYFNILDDMILSRKEEFFFKSRNRRPPMDKVNAMLSFVYTILGSDVAPPCGVRGLKSFLFFVDLR